MATTLSQPVSGQMVDIEGFIREAKRAVGQEGKDVPSGVGVADWLSVERLMNGTGDENPLFRDANYGASSAHFTMLAPPSFLFAVRTPTSVASLHERERGGALPLLTDAEVEWSDHIRLGERLDADLRIARVQAGPEWRNRTTAQVISEVQYIKGGAARPFARATGTTTVYPIPRGGREKFVERELYQYSDEQIAQLEQDLAAEPPPRGNRPRYWSETVEGERLPILVKGPLSLSDFMAWAVAEAKPMKLGGLVYREILANPGRKVTNLSTNWPFWDSEQEAEDIQSCQDAGFPGPYGRGAMRVALAIQALTNWMGDDGFLRRIAVQLPNPFIYGDAMRLGGSVTDKFTQQIGNQTYNAVEVALHGINQLGESALEAQAIVYLPDAGMPVVLPVA
jgi:acyl dehydratase